MTTRSEKIDNTKKDLTNAPNDVIDFRMNVVDTLELYEDTFDELASGLRTNYVDDKNLPMIANTLGAIRSTCLGANTSTYFKFDIGPASGFAKNENFDFPILVDSTTNKPKFAVRIEDPNFNYQITLSNSEGSTVTKTETDGTSNTFSNYVGDYYFVRSRETGRILDIVANTTPYVTPSTDVPFGNAVTFGESTTAEAGNWNENFAFANIESVTISSTLDQFINISHTMENGSDSSTPVKAPILKNILPLKRHDHDYETLIITANTTASSNSIITSNASFLIVGSELSSSTFESNVSVTMIDVSNDTVFVDKELSSNSTNLSITSKQIMEDRERHSVFAYATVVTDGMVKNDDWKPIGDDDADYSGTNETPGEATEMDQSTFNTKLGDFIPETARTSTNIIFKSTSDITSSGNETVTDSGNYTKIEDNPFFPAVQGAVQHYDASNDQGGRQPSGLGSSDIFAGRFVAYEENRKDSGGNNTGDYRYMVDFAAKFFYLPNPLTFAQNLNTVPTSLPNTNTARGTEPLKQFADGSKTVLTDAIERVRVALNTMHGNTKVLNSSGGTPGTLPSGFSGTFGSSPNQVTFAWGTAAGVTVTTTTNTTPSNATIFAKSGTGSYSVGDIIFTHQFTGTNTTNLNDEGQVASYNVTRTYTITETDCAWNDLMHMLNGDADNGLSSDQTGDYEYIKARLKLLNDLRAYRDPITEVDGGAEYNESKKTAAESFDTAILNAFADFPDVDALSSTGPGSNDNPSGLTLTTTACNTLRGTLDIAKTQIGLRIQELDSRLGEPTYTGSQSSNGTLPAIRVSAIPAKTSGTMIPYGRTIYGIVNLLLGDDVGLLSSVTEEAANLNQSYKNIRDDRNTYDILSGRSKYYGS